MKFFNKYLCPINLRASDDRIELKEGFAQSNNAIYFANHDDNLMKFTHFRWTKNQPILSANQIQLSSYFNSHLQNLDQPKPVQKFSNENPSNKKRMKKLKKRKNKKT